MELKCTREACGNALVEVGKKYPEAVVLSADLSGSTRTDEFARVFPDRFFNMGVAEANMVNTAAGLALAGKIPFATSFAIFATGRVWEQVRNTIGYAGLNVKIIATHSGLSVGPDGSSHQGIEDIALMRLIPGMTVLAPSDAVETPKAIFAAARIKGPVYIRLARVKLPVVTSAADPFNIGQANILRSGRDAVIIACGSMVAPALAAADRLSSENISPTVINMHTIKPLDKAIIIKEARSSGAIVTAEEHLVAGGLGSAVAEVVSQNCPVPIEMVGIQDQFGQSGEAADLLKAYHLTADDIYQSVKKVIERRR